MTGNKTDRTKLPQPSVIACPGCKAEIGVVTYHQAKCYVCAGCHSVYKNDVVKGLTKDHVFKNEPRKPVIPLHSRGIVQGNKYEVIGFLAKREKRSDYEWEEYLLYNPEHGYATLSLFNGHWNFIYQLNHFPRSVPKSKREVEHDLRKYHLYNIYKSTVLYAEGEFYDDIMHEGDTQVREFIQPPYMLVNENSGDEIRWFLGEYMSPSDVKSAFKLDAVPARSGVGSTQLMVSAFKFEHLLAVTVVFACLLGLIQLFFSFGATEKMVLNKVYHKSQLNTEKMIVTEPFELTDGTSALEFKVSSSLNNNWLDVDVELINDLTGERYEAVKSLEFYSGYDDEGSWTEGSQSESVIISAVPEGKYHLNITPDWGKQANDWDDPSFSLLVKHDVGLPSNFLWTLLIICIFPVIQYYRERSFEARRWMESDYSIHN